MKEYESPQMIEPGVLTLRWIADEIKEIIVEHLKASGMDLSEAAEVSFWYEQENYIPGVNMPPHHGYVMRITKKIR